MAQVSEIADVVELWVWGSRQSMTLSQLAAHIETTIPEESIECDPDGGDEPFELLSQQVFEEILDRQDSLGSSYPFACDGYKLGYLSQESGSTYIFCLLLSHLAAEHIENDQRARQFEMVAMGAAQNFFGGKALRIGAPWGTASYAELLESVIQLIPNLGANVLEETVRSGDRGWDILIVKSFGDKQFPRFVALGNCATGRRDWKRKGIDAEPDYFWECFQHPRPGVFITFSAVPFKMAIDIRKRKASVSNLTFDRFRICEYADGLDVEVANWVDGQRQHARDIPLDSLS